jgi:hypothetical protein
MRIEDMIKRSYFSEEKYVSLHVLKINRRKVFSFLARFIKRTKKIKSL